jgi:phospholipase/carboxylesterase
MKHTVVRAGPLQTHLIDVGVAADAKPATLVVLCHGFGAPGTDLVPIAGEVAQLSRAVDRVRFAFPEAPLDLADIGYFGARAWFPIDVERLMTEGRSGRADELAVAAPPGMDAAKRALAKTVEALLTESGLPWSRLILGGFSQGAMMAIELTLSADEAPAGLWAWSPTLVDRPALIRRAPRRAGLPVYMSHGRQDAILPFAQTVELADLMKSAGLDVEFGAFNGPHTIPAHAIEVAAKRLGAL